MNPNTAISVTFRNVLHFNLVRSIITKLIENTDQTADFIEAGTLTEDDVTMVVTQFINANAFSALTLVNSDRFWGLIEGYVEAEEEAARRHSELVKGIAKRRSNELASNLSEVVHTIFTTRMDVADEEAAK